MEITFWKKLTRHDDGLYVCVEVQKTKRSIVHFARPTFQRFQDFQGLFKDGSPCVAPWSYDRGECGAD